MLRLSGFEDFGVKKKSILLFLSFQ